MLEPIKAKKVSLKKLGLFIMLAGMLGSAALRAAFPQPSAIGILVDLCRLAVLIGLGMIIIGFIGRK